jgi:hypothetical protein
MRKVIALVTMLVASISFVGCAHLGSEIDLAQVAQDNEMKSVTTGDGGYSSFADSGTHYRSLEFGIAVGIPIILKFMELYPMQSDEAHLGQIAQEAKADGANALINVQPPRGLYTGFPFFIVGLYIDRTEGTGVTVN